MAKINLIGAQPPARGTTPQPAKQAAAAPKPQMSERERESRERSAELFRRFDQAKALSAEFGSIDYDFCGEFANNSDMSIDQARRELAKRAALRSWATAFATVGRQQ